MRTRFTCVGKPHRNLPLPGRFITHARRCTKSVQAGAERYPKPKKHAAQIKVEAGRAALVKAGDGDKRCPYAR